MKHKLEILRLLGQLHNQLWWLFLKNGINISKAFTNSAIHIKDIDDEELNAYLIRVTDYIIKGVIPKDDGVVQILDTILEYAGEETVVLSQPTQQDMLDALESIPVEHLPRA